MSSISRRCQPGCTCGKHRGKIFQPESDAAYGLRHQRVYYDRGAASDHSCLHCGKIAREWAWVHDTDGLNTKTDYIPLCRKCHRSYDDIPERIKAALTGYVHSDKSRETMSAAHRGKVHSDETKQKMREVHRKNPPPVDRSCAVCGAGPFSAPVFGWHLKKKHPSQHQAATRRLLAGAE